MGGGLMGGWFGIFDVFFIGFCVRVIVGLFGVRLFLSVMVGGGGEEGGGISFVFG